MPRTTSSWVARAIKWLSGCNFARGSCQSGKDPECYPARHQGKCRPCESREDNATGFMSRGTVKLIAQLGKVFPRLIT